MLLQLLGLSQYEAVLLEAGYDDIDFVTDITLEELVDVGISKKGTSSATGSDIYLFGSLLTFTIHVTRL